MKITLILFALTFSCTNSYKILAIFPYYGKSHFSFFEPLMKALAVKGHEVTVISRHPQKSAVANYVDVDVRTGTEPSLNFVELNDTLAFSRYRKYFTPYILARNSWTTCSEFLSHSNFQSLIKESKVRFDVVIAEFFHTRCFLGVVHKFKAPLVGISSSVLFQWHDIPLGMPSNPAYIPNAFMPFSDKMNFFEKVLNTVLYVFNKVVFKLLIDIPDNRLARKYLGDLPALDDIAANMSVMLLNTHFTHTTPRPMVPGYIEVAGMHIGKAERVPDNIEKWINESTHGVIYFSLGSMIKGDSFPEEKRQMFLRAFGRLHQRVLWKWETEMPGKPDNVMTQKWMPQFDILSHPNVKAFISHGGLLGTTEAVHCGLPMIVMPQFGDQFTNAKALEASGGGVILDFHSLDEESIYNALKTVLDPSFNKKAKELSARFRDRPLPPLDTAIYWVEYVARHGGAPHMRTAAVGMPFYKYLLLDVVAFLAAVLFIIAYISYRLTKAVFRRIFKASPSPKVKKN